MRLGIDTGGTFTDFVWLNESGRLVIHKELSTPRDPSLAILAGVNHLSVPLNAPVVHGSTVATNALLERRGARTALITTAGFADVLEIGRQDRPELYALVPRKPEPLVPRRWRFEVPERVTAQGEILMPLDTAALAPILEQLAADHIESVTVCLLFSFLRPEHEQQIRQAIEQWATAWGVEMHISLSCEILPEYREYERTATTVINAYVAPHMSRYLRRLTAGLAPRPLTIMQSNGGVISAVVAAAEPARTVLSGPAGGVVGARFVAGLAGFENIITFDMGGTSTDVALCPGRLPTTSEGEIASLPLRLPIIDIHTVGAGGGSLARVDLGGALHVGPQSAGADPGPACYQRNGDTDARLLVTTTDANLVLGRLDADHFLGGALRLNLERAIEALTELAAHIGAATPEAAAWDVVQVANIAMERAIRRISVERGYDPRLYTLVAFGGAGPLHACDLAQHLHIPRVLVPAAPGVLSALGMLVAAPTKDYSQTVMLPPGPSGDGADKLLTGKFAYLEERAQAEMTAEGHPVETLILQRTLDMRYVGQSFELNVPYESDNLERRFHEAHQQRYGYQRPEAAVETVTIRLKAIAPILPLTLPQQPDGPADASTAILGRKPVWFSRNEPVLTILYDRATLRPGHRFNGPAVIFQYDTTTVLPPEWQATVDSFGNLLLTL